MYEHFCENRIEKYQFFQFLSIFQNFIENFENEFFRLFDLFPENGSRIFLILCMKLGHNNGGEK